MFHLGRRGVFEFRRSRRRSFVAFSVRGSLSRMRRDFVPKICVRSVPNCCCSVSSANSWRFFHARQRPFPAITKFMLIESLPSHFSTKKRAEQEFKKKRRTRGLAGRETRTQCKCIGTGVEHDNNFHQLSCSFVGSSRHVSKHGGKRGSSSRRTLLFDSSTFCWNRPPAGGVRAAWNTKRGVKLITDNFP